MKTYLFGPFLILFAGVYSSSFSQKLKKADKAIVSGIQAHMAVLSGNNMKEREAGSEGEKLAAEYIRIQFEKYGLAARGDTNSWFQSFEIYDGKEILPATSLTINSHKLILHKDFFPFPFSPDKKEEATMAIALSENGVPWFKDIKDIIEEKSRNASDTIALIKKKAAYAASKGATALFVYNTSKKSELTYNNQYRSDNTIIPVLYITKSAYKKFCSDESAMLDIKLNTRLEDKIRMSKNVIGYADNGADSIVVAGAHMNNDMGIAVLIEMARLAKTQRHKTRNHLFIVYSDEQKGVTGTEYFNEHATVNRSLISYNFNIASLEKQDIDGLTLVKQGIDILRNN